MSIRWFPLAAGLLLALPQPVLAQLAAPTELLVSARGSVARPPDLAQISGGVVSTAPTAAGAMAANASSMAAVIAAVRKAGVAERDIQTSGLSLQPQYRYANNQPRVLTGYQASNSVNLRLRDLPGVGRLLDTLVAAGANSIDGPSFSLDKPEAALDEARTAAIGIARARAALYAKAAGLQVIRIAAISEAGTELPDRPRPMMAMRAEAMADSTPVAPGEVDLGVTVTVRFELQ